jgi:hypothetical protein
MFSLSKRAAALKALGRKVPLRTLTKMQSAVLFQMLIGLSQAVNGGAAQAESVARALILDGQRRLRALRRAAPHLDLSLTRLLSRIRSNDMPDDRLSDEESALQAVLEVCLGLMLRWLSGRDDRLHTTPSCETGGSTEFFELPWPSRLSSSHLLFRARSCLIS